MADAKVVYEGGLDVGVVMSDYQLVQLS